MAIRCVGGPDGAAFGQVINYYSNPNVTWEGHVIGAYNHNNARRIMERMVKLPQVDASLLVGVNNLVLRRLLLL